MCIKGIPRVPGILEPSFSSQTVLTFTFNLHAFIMLMVLFSCQLAGVYIRKAVKFLLKQGHLQPHFHSRARQPSTQLQRIIETDLILFFMFQKQTKDLLLKQHLWVSNP